jgi:hypothetical protein
MLSELDHFNLKLSIKLNNKTVLLHLIVAASQLSVIGTDIREYIDCSLARSAFLVLDSRYVASHRLAVAPQLFTKQIFIVLFNT